MYNYNNSQVYKGKNHCYHCYRKSNYGVSGGGTGTKKPYRVMHVINPVMASNTIPLGSGVHYQQPFFALLGSGSHNGKYYYLNLGFPIPEGWSGQIISVKAQAYQSTNLYWDEAVLYQQRVTTNCTLVTDTIDTINDPFTTGTGVLCWDSPEYSDNLLYTYMDSPNDFLGRAYMRWLVRDSASTGSLYLYSIQVEVEYVKL